MKKSQPSDVRVSVCQDGPLLVRGPAVIIGEDGAEIARTRATVALCRCGLTGRPPWCDGNHKVAAGPRRRATTVDAARPESAAP